MDSDVLKEIGSIQEKARKYEHRLENDKKILEKINEVSDSLNELRLLIAPWETANLGKGRRPRSPIRNDWEQVRSNLYTDMQKGFRLKAAHFMDKYNLSSSEVVKMRKELLRMSPIGFVRDGREIVLFHDVHNVEPVIVKGEKNIKDSKR